MTESYRAYLEYCADCFNEGETPVSYWAWLDTKTDGEDEEDDG